jgi:hypothetical protein
VQVKKLQPTWRIVTRTYWLQFFIELRNFKPNKNKRQAIPASLCATKMKTSQYFIFFCLLIFLSGCINLSIKHLVGPYFLMDSDTPGGIALYSEIPGNSSSFRTVIPPQVYEAYWNENLILVKQHPMKLNEEDILKQISAIALQKNKSDKNLNNKSKSDSLNSLLNKSMESYSGNKPVTNVINYYIIDAKSYNKKMILIGEAQCDSLISELRLTKSKKYHSIF